MRRKRFHHHMSKREDTHRWLVSYADYMTLMFAFFVVLYAMAVANKSQYPVFMERLDQAVKHLTQRAQLPKRTDVLPYPKAKSVLGDGEQAIKQRTVPLVLNAPIAQKNNQHPPSNASADLDALREKIKKMVIGQNQQKNIQIDQTQDWLIITLDSQLLFASGSATLLNPARKVLAGIAEPLSQVNNYIRIRGYTDNQKIRSELFKSNWELSVIRATHVLHHLVAQQIAPQRLAIVGFGEYSPKVANDTERHREMNRRVEIAISKYSWQPPAKTKHPSAPSVEDNKGAQESGPKADSDTILTVPLPGGGVRYTTRQDRP